MKAMIHKVREEKRQSSKSKRRKTKRDEKKTKWRDSETKWNKRRKGARKGQI